MDVAAGGTYTTHSKNEAFSKKWKPNTWGDLHMLIGIFLFYSQSLTLYELNIRPWVYIFIKTRPTRKII